MGKNGILNINDLFGIKENDTVVNQEHENDVNDVNDVIEVKLSELVPFLNHKFKLYEGQRLDDMVLSIKEYGILTPIVLRKLDDGTLQILAGHNRVNAAKIAGIEKISKDKFIILRGITDEEARAIVRETNIIQRGFSELSHSEKAAVLVERHKDIKEQGRMKEIISQIENLYKADDLEEKSKFRQLGETLRSDKEIGKQYDLSPRVVSRYLRIDTLIEELKDRLDSGEIPFMVGVDLSFLKEQEQEVVETLIEDFGFKVDTKKSDVLKTLSKGRSLNYDKAYEILSEKYFDKPKKIKNFKLKPKLVRKYFKENQTEKEIEEIIDNALELYFSQKSNLD